MREPLNYRVVRQTGSHLLGASARRRAAQLPILPGRCAASSPCSRCSRPPRSSRPAAAPRSDDRPEADATLMLDFTPNAAHAGIYSAVAHGFDDAEGVHLKVRVPGQLDRRGEAAAGRPHAVRGDGHPRPRARRRERPRPRRRDVDRAASARRGARDARRQEPARPRGPQGRRHRPAERRRRAAARSSPAPAATTTRSRRSRSASTRCPPCSAAESPARPPSGTSRASRSEAKRPGMHDVPRRRLRRARPTPSSCSSRTQHAARRPGARPRDRARARARLRRHSARPGEQPATTSSRACTGSTPDSCRGSSTC